MLEPDAKELSEREREILQLVASGASNKEIAQALYISPNTVKVHLRNIFGKIGVASRTEAAMFAVNVGLVETANQPRPGENLLSSDLTVVGDNTGMDGVESLVKTRQPLSRRQRLAGLYQSRRPLAIAGALLLLAVLVFFTLRGGQGAQPIVSDQATGADQPRWQKRASMPTPRDSLAVAAYQNQIYAIGGQASKGISGVVESYDINLNTWRALAAKPVPVAEASAAVIGGRIYVPGGRQSSGKLTDALEIYDPLTNTWQPGSRLPIPLSAYALATFEGKLYLFGGWDGQHAMNSIFEYDPDRDVWLTDRSPMPTARAYAGAAVATGKIYILGGYDGVQALAVNEVYQPDRDRPGEHPWSVAAPLPEARFGAGVAGVADIIHLVGGENDQGGVSGVLEYFPQNDAWQKIPGLSSQPWSRLGLIPVGTHLYALGGQLGGVIVGENLSYQAIYTVLIPLIP
jgi:DNA-binding CsgD family transcriptional regulator